MKTTTMLCAAVVMMTSACVGPMGEAGPQGEQGPPGAQGPQGEPGEGGQGIERAGSRIVPITVETDDGAVARLGWWDSDLGAECKWRRVHPLDTGDKALCVPMDTAFAGPDSIYADAECTVFISVSPGAIEHFIDARELGVWRRNYGEHKAPFYAWSPEDACVGPFEMGPNPVYTYDLIDVAGGPVAPYGE